MRNDRLVGAVTDDLDVPYIVSVGIVDRRCLTLPPVIRWRRVAGEARRALLGWRAKVLRRSMGSTRTVSQEGPETLLLDVRGLGGATKWPIGRQFTSGVRDATKPDPEFLSLYPDLSVRWVAPTLHLSLPQPRLVIARVFPSWKTPSSWGDGDAWTVDPDPVFDFSGLVDDEFVTTLQPLASRGWEDGPLQLRSLRSSIPDDTGFLNASGGCGGGRESTHLVLVYVLWPGDSLLVYDQGLRHITLWTARVPLAIQPPPLRSRHASAPDQRLIG